MKANEAYQEYCAIKAHFERPTYDYYKYKGRVRAGNYDQRKDKHFFFRLSRTYNKKQLHEYYISNFLADAGWVGNMNKDNWKEWKNRIVRVDEVFNNDTKAIAQLIKERGLIPKDVFRYESGEHPIIFRLMLGDFIQVETWVILDQILHFHKTYDNHMEDDPIWNDWSRKTLKYGIILSKEYIKDFSRYKKTVIENILNTP